MEYVNKSLNSKVAIDLAKWMEEIKDKERVKASKLLKLINKYEDMYRPEKRYSSPPPDEL